MRPPTQPQSAIRTPLNQILGTEAVVRVLRALRGADTPLSLSELARRGSLQPTSVTAAVNRLVRTGIVERVGHGSMRLVQWREHHPLAPALTALFAAEAERLPRIVAALQGVVRVLTPPPDGVWIEGPAGSGTDRAGDTVPVRLVGAARHLSAQRDALQHALDGLGADEELTFEVRASTRADLAAAPPSTQATRPDALVVYGLGPDVLMNEPGPQHTLAPAAATEAGRPRRRDHAHAEAEALAIAGQIAERLAHEPELVDRARRHLATQRTTASPQHQSTLAEWDDILRTMSTARLQRFLVDRGERATRLRQSLPFVGALSPAERHTVLADARAAATPARGAAPAMSRTPRP